MILLALACARAPLPSPGPRTRTWDVAVAVATGDRTLEALYTLSTERVARDVWRVATVRTRGSWDGAGGVDAFDSAAPTGADPWPLTLQHLVASVPADVRMEDGRAVALVDPEGWADRARAALYAADLPPGAAATGEPLIDAAGLLADLERTFPGLPPEGEWTRSERIAGVPARRIEACTVSDADVRTWECEGRAESDGSARFHEVRTWTRLAADAVGLVWMESGWSGTLVALAPDGAGVVDRPISGLRRVERN